MASVQQNSMRGDFRKSSKFSTKHSHTDGEKQTQPHTATQIYTHTDRGSHTDGHIHTQGQTHSHTSLHTTLGEIFTDMTLRHMRIPDISQG